MKNIFKKGDAKTHTYKVQSSDIAQFESGVVHQVCSTFTLAREMEWSSRLFVLEMKEDDEEGIGTSINVEHRSPAGVGEVLNIKATVSSILNNELICDIEVKSGERIVALGSTGQKILAKSKLKQIFSSLERNGKEG